MTILQAGSDELGLVDTAVTIGQTLTQHYPGHMWMVGWQGGSIVVRNASISTDYGFYIHPDQSATTSELAKKAVMYGGELLERARMKRGAWNGDFATKLDGEDKRRPIALGQHLEIIGRE